MLRKVVLFIGLGLSACASAGTKVTSSQVQSLKVGTTTYDQVVASLGKPTSVVSMPDGILAAHYIHTETSIRPESYVPVLGAFIGGVDTGMNMTTLYFDTNKVLIQAGSNESELPGRGPLAIR